MFTQDNINTARQRGCLGCPLSSPSTCQSLCILFKYCLTIRDALIYVKKASTDQLPKYLTDKEPLVSKAAKERFDALEKERAG